MNPAISLPFEEIWNLNCVNQEDVTTGKEHLLVVYFSGDACRDCLYDCLREINIYYENFKDDLDFLLVSKDMQPRELRQFRKAKYVSYPMAMDPEGRLEISAPLFVAVMEIGRRQPMLIYQPELSHDLKSQFQKLFDFVATIF